MIRGDLNVPAGVVPAAALYRYRFGAAEFDEACFELRVRGTPVEAQRKPLEILAELLRHAGEVVTKEELLESVWGGRPTVQNVIANAVAKLRGALGEESAARILTQPRIGYRFVGALERVALGSRWVSRIELAAGAPVPGRSNFLLEAMIGRSPASEVWLARQAKTREPRVYKFSPDGVRLAGLKREATLARVLQENVAERHRFARLLDWNFELPPFFLEYEYGGENLLAWAEHERRLAQLPLAQRLGVFLQLVDAVTAAHAVGVLHRDLKPANVLVTALEAGTWQVRLTDFGSSRLLEPERLAEFGITRLGAATSLSARSDSATGTPLYVAPELLAGAPSTVRGDVYALGVMLYQFVVADLRKPLAAGWESEVTDPQLREDIALAAAGEPERRLSSAAQLAQRLRGLATRAAERARLATLAQQARAAERRREQARARRPWIVSAGVALALGAAASVYLARQASSARDRARHQESIAESVNRFLGEDLLARTSPERSGQRNETLLDAVKASSDDIDRRLAFEPAVAARLHHTLARALDGRNDWDGARAEYVRAAELWTQAAGPLSRDAIVCRLQQALMEARSYRDGSLGSAETLYAEQEALLRKLAVPNPELTAWRAAAHGMLALIKNDLALARQQFALAVQAAEQRPGSFDLRTRLTFRQRHALTLLRLGDGPGAEVAFRELIAGYTRLAGAASAEVLMARLSLAQALMIQRQHAGAIAEADAIYPLMVAALGADHERTLQLLTTRAQSHGSLEHWEAAIRDGLEVHRLAVLKQGARSFFAVSTLTDLATAQCRAARAGEGRRNAEAAYRDALAAFGAAAALTQAVAYTRAACLIALGRVELAAPLLEGIAADDVAALAGDPHWGANVELAKAQIAYTRRDYRGARAHLEAAKPGFSVPEAEPYQVRAVTALDSLLRTRETLAPRR